MGGGRGKEKGRQTSERLSVGVSAGGEGERASVSQTRKKGKKEEGKERKPGIVSLSVLRGRREGGRVRIDRATAFAFRGEIPPFPPSLLGWP